MICNANIAASFLRDRARNPAAPYGVVIQAVLDPHASLPKRQVELVEAG